MMDELELLKKDWKNRGENFPRLSQNDFYPMLLKKSSSIVRWIFYISIIEFIVPHLLYFLPSFRNGLKIYDDMGLSKIFIILSAVQYTVVSYFIYQFYKRYREISVLDNAKNLMKSIIRTRRTVKHYIIFCLSLVFMIFVISMVSIYLNDNFIADFGLTEKTKDISPEKFKLSVLLFLGAFGVLFTLVMGAVYFLLYGILLKKLNKNYNELKQLEV